MKSVLRGFTFFVRAKKLSDIKRSAPPSGGHLEGQNRNTIKSVRTLILSQGRAEVKEEIMLRRYYENYREIRLGYDFYADIAERIVEKRNAAGLTQDQLAKKAGIPANRIARYEAVKIRCRLDDLDKISAVLETTTDYLVGAQYDDPDCGDCLYTVRNERYESGDDKFLLFFCASSPQMAFLKAYKWSLDAGCIWFETIDRARVRLEGVPVRKSDWAGKIKERTSTDEDPIEK